MRLKQSKMCLLTEKIVMKVVTRPVYITLKTFLTFIMIIESIKYELFG